MFKKRSKADKNANGGLFPKVEKSQKVLERECENTYFYRPVLKTGNCSKVRTDGYVSLVFERKIRRIRGEQL